MSEKRLTSLLETVELVIFSRPSSLAAIPPYLKEVAATEGDYAREAPDEDEWEE